jgi:hypothetical protein
MRLGRSGCDRRKWGRNAFIGNLSKRVFLMRRCVDKTNKRINRSQQEPNGRWAKAGEGNERAKAGYNAFIEVRFNNCRALPFVGVEGRSLTGLSAQSDWVTLGVRQFIRARFFLPLASARINSPSLTAMGLPLTPDAQLRRGLSKLVTCQAPLGSQTGCSGPLTGQRFLNVSLNRLP